MTDRAKALRQLSCPQVNQLILPYLHGDLPTRIQESVASHLAGCSGCRDRLQDAQALEAELRVESSVPLAAMDRQASARMHQNLKQQMKTEVRMNRTLQAATMLGVIVVAIVLLAGISSLLNQRAPAALPPSFALTTQTATPATATSTPNPSPSATLRIFPGSVLPFIYQDLKFQVSQALVDDSLGILPASTTHVISTIFFNTDDLVTTSHGQVPKDPQYNGVLILQTDLLSGDKQKFLSLDLKINEGGIEKSPSAIFAEEDGNSVFWVYTINQSSTSFMLEIPDQASVDVKPMIRSTPYYFNR